MINLIRNEFTKIFNKKSTYIMYILIIILVIITNYVYKTQIDENGNFKYDSHTTEYLDYLTKELDQLDKTDVNNKEEELSLRKSIMEFELYEKYGQDSWQSYIVGNEVISLIDELVNNKYSKDINQELLQELEKEYLFYIDKFESDDWKYFVNKEKEILNNQIKELENLKQNSSYTKDYINKLEKNYNIELEILNYRLKNNISYENSYLNRALEEYLYASKIVIDTNLEEIKEYDKLNQEEQMLYSYYNNLSNMNINKYIVDNKINANKINDTRGILINLFIEYETYIIVTIVMLASSIVASEFNKGNIKQLLLVPYSRTKILLSKYITILLMIIFTIIFIIISELIIGGIFFGFTSLSIPVAVYNFNASIVETYNIFHYILINLVAKLPMYILIVTIVFLIGTLTLNNSLSIVLGLIMYFMTPIISQIAISSELDVLNYLIFSHWDFTGTLFGMIPMNSSITKEMSIMLCVMYFVIALVPSFIIFNKKDIKNM